MKIKRARDKASGRGRGRPRDPRTDQAILDAALRSLAEEGYARMSIEGVAAAAGVTKPTIYRRWPSKAHLATAALARLQDREPPVPAGGDSRARLVAALENFRKSLLRPHGMAMIGTLLVEERHTPELIALFRRQIVARRRERLRAILEDAARGGELRPEADIDAAVNALVGSYYARYLSGRRIPKSWAPRVVATVWRGIRRTTRASTAGRKLRS